MFAIALCLLLEADALPPVEVTDVYRFGITSRKQTYPDWNFINDHLAWVKRLRNSCTGPHVDWDQWLDQTYDAYVCWYVLDDVAMALDAKNGADRMRHLKKLRDVLGPHDYYAGIMPSVQPFRQFQAEIEWGK